MTHEEVDSILNELCEQMKEMKMQISELQRPIHKQFTDRGRSPYRNNRAYRNSQSPNRPRSASRQIIWDNCWYHHTFGNKARKCIKPCKHTTTDTSNIHTNAYNLN